MIGPAIGFRETRRLVGRYTLTAEDVPNRRTFEDGVGRGGKNEYKTHPIICLRYTYQKHLTVYNKNAKLQIFKSFAFWRKTIEGRTLTNFSVSILPSAEYSGLRDTSVRRFGNRHSDKYETEISSVQSTAARCSFTLA